MTLLRTLLSHRLWRRPAAFLFSVLFVVGAAHAQTMVSINGDRVNMRAGAGTSHAALWQLSNGYPLEVVAKRGDWLQVKDFEGDTGWVLGRLTAKTPHVVVKVPKANLRQSASTRSRLVLSLEYGEVLRTLKRRGDWLQVRTQDGRTGWLARRLAWGW